MGFVEARIHDAGNDPPNPFYGKHPGGRCQSLGYGGVICPAAWQAAQWGRTSIRLGDTHRPNSGTRPTLRKTAFQRHSGAAGPPPAFKSARAAGWSSFNSPIAGCTMIRCSGPAGISSAACVFHRDVMKLDSTLKLAVYILRVIVCITVLSIILLIWLSA
jgi:hypothetical protein